MQAKLTYNKHPFLKELGLSEVNNGCYRRGEFVGEGPEIVSYNPHTNEPIAIVKTATVKQYNECVVSMEEERIRWTSTPLQSEVRSSARSESLFAKRKTLSEPCSPLRWERFAARDLVKCRSTSTSVTWLLAFLAQLKEKLSPVSVLAIS